MSRKPGWILTVIRQLPTLALGFWLFLPCVGLAFWIGGGLMAERLLNQSSSPAVPLYKELQFNVQPAANFLEIRADIDKSQNRTYVTAIQVFELSAQPRRIQFELETTAFDQVETEIAQHLNIPIEFVRQLASYRIKL